MLLGIAAYIWWGLGPIYFKLLHSVAPFEILAHRVLWSFVLLIPLVWKFSSWKRVWETRSLSKLMPLMLSAFLIAINWFTFIYAIAENKVIEASFGYFLNPIFVVFLGVLFLKEKLRRSNWAALLLAIAGVSYQIYELGEIPWISILLMFSFGLYGLVRKQAAIDPIGGLFWECLLLVPFALAYLIHLSLHGTLAFLHQGTRIDVILLFAGIVTTVPLWLFTAATKRVPYSLLGFLQYTGPTIQLLLGIYAYHEPIQRGKLVCLAFCWTGLVLIGMENYFLFSKRSKAELMMGGKSSK